MGGGGGGGGGGYTYPPIMLHPQPNQWEASSPPDILVLIPFPNDPPENYDIYAEIFDTHLPDVAFVELIYTRGNSKTLTPPGFGENWKGTFELRGPSSPGAVIGTSVVMGHFILNAQRKSPVSPGTPIRYRMVDISGGGGNYYAIWSGVGPKDSWYWPRARENSRFVAGRMPPPLDGVLSRFQVEVTGIPGTPRYKINPATSGLDLRQATAKRAISSASSQPLITSDRPAPPVMESGIVTP